MARLDLAHDAENWPVSVTGPGFSADLLTTAMDGGEICDGSETTLFVGAHFEDGPRHHPRSNQVLPRRVSQDRHAEVRHSREHDVQLLLATISAPPAW
jgi:hypothetical protein